MHTFVRSFCLLACLALHAAAAQAERYTVPLLVPAPTTGASTTGAPQGVVRILNATDESGAVAIYAINDAGTRSGPATFTLSASAAVQFTATDLQSGNATLGLTGGIGTGVGDARLQIETDLAIVPLAFVRAADGTLSAMHDTVRAASVGGSDGYTYEVPTFNPASEVTQVSRLRLINPGDAAAAVTIGGRDDSGAAATGGDVTLTLAAGGSQTLTAQQLEAGDTAVTGGLGATTGRLGAGTGRWRLTVSSDRPLQVVNIVAASAGYWNNLSTTAVPGAAPANLESLNQRFLGNAVMFATGSRRFTLDAQSGARFTETAESDGVSSTSMGRYGYARTGPDAGRLTLTYDGGGVCAVNLYFSTRTAGWFASHCTGSDEPTEGTWLAGSWSVGDEDGDTDTVDEGSTDPLMGGDCYVGLRLGPEDSCNYPGTADMFSVNVRGRGSFLGRLAGIRIQINNETIDGRVYDFEASHQGDGVWRIDRIAGSTEEPAEPPMTGGGGMEPEDDDGAGVSEGFALFPEGLTTGATSLAWGNGRFYILDRPALKVFAYSAAGLRDPTADFDLIAGNSNAEAMVYANGRFHVVDLLDDKVYAYSASGQREAAADFDLVADNADPAAITYALGRFYVLDFAEEKAYAYSASGQHEAVHDFDLNLEFPFLGGIAYANDRFHVLDGGVQRVHAYSASGERDPAADFDLRLGNAFLQGIVYANGRFHFLDWRHERVHAYSATGQPDSEADFDLHADTNSRPTAIAFANSRFHVVDWADRKVYSYSASGAREATADFDLSPRNLTPRGITHGNGRFYVADSNDIVYAYSASGQYEATAGFGLHAENRHPSGITYANGRFHVVDWFDDKVYAYSSSGQYEAAADFFLNTRNTSPHGIAFAGGRFYIADITDEKVYAYSASGQHDAAADFDLHADNANPRGVAYANDRLHVVDLYSGRVHEYAVPAAPDGSGETGSGSPADSLVLSGCSDGTYVNDPGGNSGLVGDCEALVRIAAAFAEGRELPAGHILGRWGSGDLQRIERWSGVQVSGGRVTRLVLDNSQLIGVIPAAIGELSALQVLSLAGNELSGAVPAGIGALSSLTYLDLSSNELTDIAALAGNAQWGAGVRIDMSDNALNDESLVTHIPALIARGVAVNHDVSLVDEFPDSRLYRIYNDNVAIMRADGDLTAAATYGANLAAYSADFYRWFQDEFDHLLFVSNLTRFEDQANVRYAGVYYTVMNDTQGIGLSTFFDNRYGSAGTLRGVLHFPYNSSLRSGPSLHELLHAWANYAVPTVLGAHWGFSSANGQLGGFDIANLEDLGNGQWTAGRFGTFANGGNSLPYSPIELYFAGLLPREDVPDLWVAADGAWLRSDNGAVATTGDGKPIFTANDVRTYTIEDIVAERGERDPSMAERPHQRGAVILLIDDDHLPTSADMQTVSQNAAWLSHRGEDGTGLYNYHEATGGRGSLTLDGLSGLRKSEADEQATLPASFGVLPPPRMTTVEELCEPFVCRRAD